MQSTTVVTCAECGRRNRVPRSATGVPRCGQCHARLPWIVDAGDDDYDDVVGSSTIPVLLDLWAPWCGPCRLVSPALERLAGIHAGCVKLVKVNVDEAPAIAERFSVRGIPTLIVLDGQDIVARQTGALPEQALQSWLSDAIGAHPSTKDARD